MTFLQFLQLIHKAQGLEKNSPHWQKATLVTPLWFSIHLLIALMTTQTACYLTPHIWVAFMFISCCTAVNHLAPIYTSDWLTKHQVNLSSHTWTHFSTLFHNKVGVKVLSPWVSTYCHQDVITRITHLLDNTCISEAFGVRTDGTAWILCHGLSQLLPLAISFQQLHYKRTDRQSGCKKRSTKSQTITYI